MSLIIIGKKGFIAKNLTYYFKKKKIKHLNISLTNFLRLNSSQLSEYTNLINCSINEKIIKDKYKKKNDFDRLISNKISFLNLRYIFLSTRKVYGKNIFPNERTKINPKCNYSKNKLISENQCKRILNRKLIILRVSNLIGFRKFSNKRMHKTFIDNFYLNLKKGHFRFNFDDYKDFLSIDQFCRVIEKICANDKVYGTFNLSLGKKIFLKDLIQALLSKTSKKKILIINDKNKNSDNFVLNNKKLLNKLKFKIQKKELIEYCKILSKKIG